MNKFEQFLNEANPETVNICGIEFNQVEALKMISLESYAMLYDAWMESDSRPALRLISA